MSTLVTFLLDRTGSMERIRDDTVGAFNAYLETLQEGDDDVHFSLIQFDSISIDKTHVNQPVRDIPRLDRNAYRPRASTPLIDAAYKTIKAVEKSVNGNADTRVVICIQTDGQENASTEHAWDELNALIKEKSEQGWQFNFMGASIDAYKQGSRMGIDAANTMSYDSTDRAATRTAFKASAANTMSYARGEAISTSYSDEQKTHAGDRFKDQPHANNPHASHPGKPGQPSAPTSGKARKQIVDDITL